MEKAMSIQEIENQMSKQKKIALALIEQCKSEGDMTVHDLMEVFKLALLYIGI